MQVTWNNGSKFHITSSNFKGKIVNSRDSKWVESSINKIKNHITTDQLNILQRSSKVFKRLFNAELPVGANTLGSFQR